jgi:hypothetical protein
MEDTYIVYGQDKEYLKARRVSEGIELTCRNERRDIQVTIYHKGFRISKKVFMADGSNALQNSEGEPFLHGDLVIYGNLGPELMEEIPKDWYADLGNLGKFLMPKEEKTKDTLKEYLKRLRRGLEENFFRY